MVTTITISQGREGKRIKTLEVYIVQNTRGVHCIKALEVYLVTTLEVYRVIALEVYPVNTRGIKCLLEVTKTNRAHVNKKGIYLKERRDDTISFIVIAIVSHALPGTNVHWLNPCI